MLVLPAELLAFRYRADKLLLLALLPERTPTRPPPSLFCPHAFGGLGHYAGLVRYDAAKLGKFQKKTVPKGGLVAGDCIALAAVARGCTLLHIQQNLSRTAIVRVRVASGVVSIQIPR